MSEIEELREVVREAHAAIKDLTRLLRESKEERGFIDAYMDEQFQERLDEVVVEGLARYEGVVEQAIEEAEKSVLARFDAMGNVLLGEDWQTRKNGQKSLPELIKEAVGGDPAPSFVPPGFVLTRESVEE